MSNNAESGKHTADQQRPSDADTEQKQDDALDEFMNEAQEAGDQDLQQTVAQLSAEVEEANRRLLMAQADLENFRKRVRRDYEEQIRYAPLPLMRDILAVLDNLHRAIEAGKANDSAAGLRDGVAMVAKQLEDAIAKHQCQPIPAEGELFDPNYHEAISQMPSESHPAGTVAHEAVRGYQLHDRVVRPSQVIVSTGSARDR